MKSNKGILLFEVAFVVLLVSIISLFLFRGFGVFLKAGRKSLDYLKLSSLVEEKFWDLEMIEAKDGFLSKDVASRGEFERIPFKWNMNLVTVDDSSLNKCILKIERQGNRKLSLDAIIFVSVKEE
ncbi:MAG: hypothetical protein ABIH71_05215 [Candidatus Omnitrophota bacterium]|nr:hypothetical protein [Candidatus Omnitrophota bacterium]